MAALGGSINCLAILITSLRAAAPPVAGSGRCRRSALANRLSADPQNKVLLIEAGPWDSNPFYRIPVMGVQLYLWNYNNWNYQTEP